VTARIVFSESAREDRRDITAYTVDRFGVEQARRLRRHLERVLISLADSPMMGTQRPELDPPGCSFRYIVAMRIFIIVHQPSETGIRVARILHASRDLAAELDRDAGTREEGSER